MICDKWLHIYGNKLGTGVKCEWVDDVNVVEVVRCKDCKYRKKNTFCLNNMRYEDDNGFCSYGERGKYEKGN